MAHSVKSYIKPLIGSALVGSSLFQLALPLLAQTAADTPVRNRATATYSDGENTFNATSNEVVITVAEVAGIEVINAGITDLNNGAVIQGDTLEYNFLIKNVGNADTYAFIPGADQIAVDGGYIDKVEIVEFNDAAITAVNIPGDDPNKPGYDAGTAINTDATNNSTEALISDNSGLLQPSKTLKVKVTVIVTESNAGQPVNVRFGDTTDNPGPNSANNQQNIADDSDAGNANLDDVRTLNYDSNDADSDPEEPANGAREAANIQEVTVATSIKPLALASVFKARTAVNDNGTTDTAKDDTITYRLDFEVESSSPAAGFQAANLEGTNINLDDGTGSFVPTQKILISDAIPAGTVIDPDSIDAVDGNVNGEITVNSVVWEVVYTTDDANTIDPLSANWTRWGDGTGVTGTVTRIGFITTDTVLPNTDTTDDALPIGYTTTTDTNGFSFAVTTSGLAVTGGTVANIAQIFGQTVGDATGQIIYDESGDQNPNNFQGNVAPDTDGSAYNPGTDLGIADPNDPDTGNNNTGNGPKGESNVVDVTATPVSTSQIKNGPDNQPSALGPNSDQDDFQNQSTDVAANTGQEQQITPNEVTFTNTVLSPGTAVLNNVIIRPIRTAIADTATDTTGQFTSVETDLATGQLTDIAIPNNTQVVIEYGTQSATYTYDGTSFNLTAGTTVVIPTLNPGVANQQDYTVKVTLPQGDQLEGISIPVVAYVDNDGNDTFNFDPDPAARTDGDDTNDENIFNITIDRVYTGYLRLYKESRVLKGDGPDVQGTDGTFSATDKSPAPGNIIEYRINYENISADDSGTGNAVLDAVDVVITEDGTGGGVGNNWAVDNDNNGEIDTSNVVGSSADNGASTINYFSGASATTSVGDQTGTTANTDVTKYVNEVTGTIAPGTVRTFTFKRKVN